MTVPTPHLNDESADPIGRDHRGLPVLPLQECLDLLRSTTLGRLAFVHSGAVLVLPVNYVLDGLTVVLRTSLGSKLQAAEDGVAVGFEIDRFDRTSGHGWSVLVQGTARVVDDPEAIERYRRLGLAPASGIEPAAPWIALRADEITGRRLPSGH